MQCFNVSRIILQCCEEGYSDEASAAIRCPERSIWDFWRQIRSNQVGNIPSSHATTASFHRSCSNTMQPYAGRLATERHSVRSSQDTQKKGEIRQTSFINDAATFPNSTARSSLISFISFTSCSSCSASSSAAFLLPSFRSVAISIGSIDALFERRLLVRTGSSRRASLYTSKASLHAPRPNVALPRSFSCVERSRISRISLALHQIESSPSSLSEPESSERETEDADGRTERRGERAGF